MNVLESHGKNEARVYAVVEVPPPRPDPPMESDRVLIVDPRETSTVSTIAGHAGTGPRNADQMVWPLPAPPAIDLPDGLPATKAQRVHVDPELVAKWRAEAEQKRFA